MSSGSAIQKINYTHAACADIILATPGITQRELAAKFGYTEGWMCRIIQSDAFREYLAGRKSELTDPVILQGLEERLRGVAARSLEVIAEKLDCNPTADFAVKAAQLSTQALGYGAKERGPTVQVNQYLVHTPAKSVNAQAWLESHSPAIGPPPVIDVAASA